MANLKLASCTCRTIEIRKSQGIQTGLYRALIEPQPLTSQQRCSRKSECRNSSHLCRMAQALCQGQSHSQVQCHSGYGSSFHSGCGSSRHSGCGNIRNRGDRLLGIQLRLVR